MASSPVPRCSQRVQQQTAECLLGSGVRETVETAPAWLPVAGRGGDSVDSTDGTVEEGGAIIPLADGGNGEQAAS